MHANTLAGALQAQLRHRGLLPGDVDCICVYSHDPDDRYAFKGALDGFVTHVQSLSPTDVAVVGKDGWWLFGKLSDLDSPWTLFRAPQGTAAVITRRRSI
jgi:hypothetical protein